LGGPSTANQTVALAVPPAPGGMGPEHDPFTDTDPAAPDALLDSQPYDPLQLALLTEPGLEM
jgi:hypothetical protein